MAERQELPFSVGDIGIMSTEEIDAIENFLDSDPNEVQTVKKNAQKTPPKKEVKVPTKTEEPSDTSEEEPKQEPKRELSQDEFFGELDDQQDDEEEQEEEETPAPKKEKKTTGQKMEEKVNESEQEEDDQEDSEEEPVNVFSAIAKELVDHGIFSLNEGEQELKVTTGEELLQRFQVESIKKAQYTIDKFIGRFGQDYQDMFDSVFIQGVPPGDYLSRYTRIEEVESIDITEEANQERVVRELLRSEGRSSEYIEKAVSRLRNYGDLADEAKEAKALLIEKENEAIEEMKIQKQSENQRKQQIRAEYLENVSNILSEKIKAKEFDGIPVDRRFAEITHQYITQEKYQTPNGQLLTEFDRDILDLNRPDKHELKVKLGMLMQLLKQDPTLSRLAKKAVSKETGELFQSLKRATDKRNTPKGLKKQQDAGPTSWFDKTVN